MRSTRFATLVVSASLCSAVWLVGCNLKVGGQDDTSVQISRGGSPLGTTVQCTASSDGKCALLVYAQRCSSISAASGVAPRLTCELTEVQRMVLAVGESRHLAAGDAVLKTCQGSIAAPPTLASCLGVDSP